MHFQTIHLNITSSTSFMQDPIPLPIAIGMFYCLIVPLFFSQAGWYSLLHRAQEISPPFRGSRRGWAGRHFSKPKTRNPLALRSLGEAGKPETRNPKPQTPLK
jgi:hypothetical protein